VRVGVNLIPLRPGRMGGAEVYFRDLLAELSRRGDHEYVLVTADYNHATLPADSTGCRRVPFKHDPVDSDWRGSVAQAALRGSAQAVAALGRAYDLYVPLSARPWLKRGFSRLASAAGTLRYLRAERRRQVAETLREIIRRERIDLWFCPFTSLDPRVPPVPSLITVFDLQHEHFPEFFHPDELAHRRRFYPESCAGADHVITISEFTRQGVMDHYGVEPRRVTTVWLAPAAGVDWADGRRQIAEVRRRHGLPSRYAFYPANTWRHKNHARLVEALARYRAVHGSTLGLVLTGAPAEGHAALESALDTHDLRDAVRVLGYVPRTDLPGLYAGAECLVLPSLFEGFGIPAAEAMLAGCPVAAARTTSLPEIVGDAAVLFDPLDPADIARAIARILHEPGLAQTLARRGADRAPRFSIARMADETLAVFERVVAQGLAVRQRPGREAVQVEGVWDDCWMGTEAVVLLVGALESVEVEGEVAGIPLLLPQSVMVEVGGSPAASVSLPAAGPFSFTVPLDGRGAAGGFQEVRLVPDRTICPRRLGWSDDERDLSLQVRRLTARTRDGREIVKRLGAPAVA